MDLTLGAIMRVKDKHMAIAAALFSRIVWLVPAACVRLQPNGRGARWTVAASTANHVKVDWLLFGQTIQIIAT